MITGDEERTGGAMRRRVREVPIVERSEQEPGEAKRSTAT
jgi:hypothetical protein